MFNVYSQECGTESPINYQTYDNFNEQRLANTTAGVANNYCINVCFRIVRNDDGTNVAFNSSNIPQTLNLLNLRFNPFGISFKQVGTYDYINNSNLNNATGLSNVQNIPNALNIYFVKVVLSGQNTAGIAYFSSNKIRVKASSGTSETIPHEVGHCLNLMHTFQCSYNPFSASPCYGFNQSCAENPNGTEGLTKGDLVQDTPADKYITNNSCIPATWNANLYHPDESNIMGYWLVERNHFTVGQGNRMKNSIIGAPELQKIRSYECAEIVGNSRICRGTSQTYTFSGASFGTPTYSWSVTGSLQIVGSTTGSSVTVIQNPTTPVSSTIKVIINGTITKTKFISRYCHSFFYKPVGIYDWVSKDYGNMGIIVPVNSQDSEPNVTYLWDIKENINNTSTNNQDTKAFFVGALSNEPMTYRNTTNQAIVNWGSSSNSYLITCNAITEDGEQFLISSNYVDVGDPKNNPCFKNNITTSIAPNPVTNGRINVSVIKPTQTTPCDYKNTNEPQFFNSDLDKIDNAITIFDYNGNQVYSNIFKTNEFTIDNPSLISGNNYVVNLYTNEGGFTQQVIVIE